MTKKLVKHGNSYAIIIDKAILKMLDITPDTSLNFSVQDEGLMISPASKAKALKDREARREQKQDREVDEITDRLIKKYAGLLKKLSKT